MAAATIATMYAGRAEGRLELSNRVNDLAVEKKDLRRLMPCSKTCVTWTNSLDPPPFSPKKTLSSGHCGHIYERIHKNAPFFRWFPLSRSAASQVQGKPILPDLCPVRAYA